MTAKRSKLPIGIQSFCKIREDDYYYVDKTPMAWALAQESGYYFLSRPRRFGKSLFIDTLAELFEANEAPFKGLYIHPLWNWKVPHPVIHISFSDGVLQSRAELDRRIYDLLRVNRERLGLTCPDVNDVASCFGELIRQAYQHFGQRVVILVDEYDKPLLDNITNREVAIAMGEGLKGALAHHFGVSAPSQTAPSPEGGGLGRGRRLMARVDEIGALAHPTKWRFMGRVGEITSHLVAVFGQQSGLASGFIRETDMASFILRGGSFAMPVSGAYS